MKIAIFTDTFLPQINGVTNTLNKMAQYYEKNNIEYIILAPEYDAPNDEFYNTERFFSLKFLLYPECRFTIPNKYRIISSLADFKPDVIQLMTEFSMGVTGLNYAKKNKIPTVSNYTTNFSQYLNYYKLDFLKSHIWNYMRWFHTQNNLTLCPTPETQLLLKRQSILNTEIFSRGIDSEDFNPGLRSYKLRKSMGIDDKIALLYVGRVSPEKDLDVLLNSYQSVYEKYGDKVVMIITGEGPWLEKCKNEFPKGTIFTGFKKGKELAEIYASSDIFVFPSSTETFGNVVLEAMSSGLPVIGADAGGVKNIISHRENGLRFKARDVETLRDAMFELIENEELRNTLKINGRNTGLKRSWGQLFNGLLDIYQNVIEEHKNSESIIGA